MTSSQAPRSALKQLQIAASKHLAEPQSQASLARIYGIPPTDRVLDMERYYRIAPRQPFPEFLGGLLHALSAGEWFFSNHPEANAACLSTEHALTAGEKEYIRAEFMWHRYPGQTTRLAFARRKTLYPEEKEVRRGW